MSCFCMSVERIHNILCIFNDVYNYEKLNILVFIILNTVFCNDKMRIRVCFENVRIFE